MWDMEIPERSEFSPQTRVLADGTKRKYPAGRCKKCVAEDAKERKQRIANDPEWKAKRLAWEKKWRKKNRQKLRAYHRHYSAMRRRNQGAKVRGPWKKFQVVERVPREPFVEYVEGLLEDGMSILEIAYLSGVDESRLRQTVKGTYQHKGKTAKIQNVTVDVVDRVLLGTHSPLHLSDLYPELYED